MSRDISLVCKLREAVALYVPTRVLARELSEWNEGCARQGLSLSLSLAEASRGLLVESGGNEVLLSVRRNENPI